MKMPTYILTGATGVIGSAVLKPLLKTDCRIFLLVRARSEADLVRRVKGMTAFAAPLPKGAEKRIIPLAADLTAPGLGLAPADRKILLEQADHILHCAGNVRMNLPLAQTRQQVLAMTQGTIALMEESARISGMTCVSTVGVAGCRTGALAEDWVIQPRAFRNSYEAAKAEAEALIMEKCRQGLNIRIVRPSMVVGDAITGQVIRFQVFYHLCEFLSGGLTLGWIPDLSKVSLDLVPSDHVARILVLAATWDQQRGNQRDRDLPPVLHACAGKHGRLPMADLVPVIRERFAQRGIALPKPRTVPVRAYGLIARALGAVAPARKARRLATLPHFLAYLTPPQWFENHRTLAAMSDTGIAPPDYRQYLTRVLDYYLDHRRP